MNMAIHAMVPSGGPAAEAPQRAALLRTLLEKGVAVSYTASAGPGVKLEGPTVPPASQPELNWTDLAAVTAAVDQARTAAPVAATWKPWFPVIDYQRCTNCMQCLSFCLFEVYGVSKTGKIQVQHQNNCKTDCPACSRVCPEVAIMFPKYRHGPINGDEVNSDDIRREAMKVDISALLGGDIYSLLRDRSAKAKSRFSKERDDDRALQERQNCLLKLQKDLEIPPEVLGALPSVEEIRAKADAAMARARALTGESAGN